MIDEEELARELCHLGGLDPDEIMANDGPRWKYYIPQARAAIAYIVPRERERCAKVADEVAKSRLCRSEQGWLVAHRPTAEAVADGIRNRWDTQP